MSDPKNHVIIIDGTQSRLRPGIETNAGLLFKLLDEARYDDSTTLHYDPGVQGHGVWDWVTLASGLGINQQIRNAYGVLARRYRPGDRIFLFGYSRGAYAVRSVAGMIAQLGLLDASQVNKERLMSAFTHYERKTKGPALDAFCAAYCHREIAIEMIGVWDTVKALGLPYPLLSRLAPMSTEFHNHRIGPRVKQAYQALALDETRTAYAPVIWDAPATWKGQMQQVWFIGAHSDVGGHIWAQPKARALSNIALNWMLEKAQQSGLTLPPNWRARFPEDSHAPPVGSYRGIAKFFLFRAKRHVGQGSYEFLHPSLAQRYAGQQPPLRYASDVK